MLEVCHAVGSRKGLEQNVLLSTEHPKALLRGQPAKFSLALRELPATH